MIATSEDDDDVDGDGATGDEVDDGDGGRDGRWRNRIQQQRRWRGATTRTTMATARRATARQAMTTMMIAGWQQ
jgi:hypothetical protein